METEITVSNACILEAIAILEAERGMRIRHGDGDVQLLDEIIEALGVADRIVIR